MNRYRYRNLALRLTAIAFAFSLVFGHAGCTKRPVVIPAKGDSSSSVTNSGQTNSELPKFLNTSLDVAYVADQQCTECHQEIAEQFAQHPMGNSLATIEQATQIEGFEAQHRASFVDGNLRYDAKRDAGKLIHARTLIGDSGDEPSAAASAGQLTEQVDVAFVVGSGQRGRSYLVNHENYLFMSPMTWYPKQQKWDLSPGYEQNDLGFNRPVQEDCLYCHSNRALNTPNTKNKYESPIFAGHSIGCQRCHGPGDVHVKHHQSGPEPHGVAANQIGNATNDLKENVAGGDVDYTIVNPAHLTPSLRESVCQQCHLAGVARVTMPNKNRYDFRPGLPLESTIATYVVSSPDVDDPAHFVGQVEQMYDSRCFIASEGRLGCISCHDPHSTPSESEKAEFYSDRCLQCHSDSSDSSVSNQAQDSPNDSRSNSVNETKCSQPLDKRLNANGVDDCVACHMPTLQTDVRHASVTDHRVPRRLGEGVQSGESSEQAKLRSSPYFIKVFPPRTAPADPITAGRNLAVGLLQASLYHPNKVNRFQLKKVLVPLEQAAKRNPTDLDTAEAVADSLARLGSLSDATDEYLRVLEMAPEREHSLVKLADTATKRGRIEDPTAAWTKAIEVNPWMPIYQERLANIHAKAYRWQQAYDLVEPAVKRFPTSKGLWQLLVESSLQLDLKDEATRGLEVLLKLAPDSAAEIQQWYDGHPKNQ